MNGRIAIVGASARAAAFSAWRTGWETQAADLFADTDLQRIGKATAMEDYPYGLAAWLASVDVEGWSYTGGLENWPDLIDQMTGTAPLWGNGGEVLRRVRSPWKLSAALTDAGFLFPETRSSADDISTDGSWLTKTYRGSGGTGVSPYLGRATTQQDIVYQPRIEGTPVSAVYVAARREAKLLGATLQLVGIDSTGGPSFHYAGSIGSWQGEGRFAQQMHEIGALVASRFDLVGVFGIDMIAGPDGLWPVEVNPRYPASAEIIERNSHVSIMETHIAACRDGMLPDAFQPRSSCCTGKAIYFAASTRIVTQSFFEWADRNSRKHPWPLVTDVPAIGTEIPAGRPVVSLFSEGRDADQVRRRLRKLVAEAQNRLAP